MTDDASASTSLGLDRRARRLAAGLVRPAMETGVPRISTPLRRWTTGQMRGA